MAASTILRSDFVIPVPVLQVNDRTTVCRGPSESLVVAKREDLLDETVIADRFQLISRLRASGFPCPGIVEIDAQIFQADDRGIVFYQQYVDFGRWKKGRVFQRRFLIDAIELLQRFQACASDHYDPVLAARFRPLFEDYVQQRLREALDRKNRCAVRVIYWLREQLEHLEQLAMVACHGSFRHHNLFYDERGKLYLIDFFHGIYYAPRIYDLCVLMSHFPRGAQLRAIGATHRVASRARQPIAWLKRAYRWGVYRPGLVADILSRCSLDDTECHLLIPCLFASLLRNKDFVEFADSPGLESFVSTLSKLLRTDNHPFRRDPIRHNFAAEESR
jgi:hypothetical protein